MILHMNMAVRGWWLKTWAKNILLDMVIKHSLYVFWRIASRWLSRGSILTIHNAWKNLRLNLRQFAAISTAIWSSPMLPFHGKLKLFSTSWMIKMYYDFFGIIFLRNTFPVPTKKKKLDWDLRLKMALGALLKLCSISTFSRLQCVVPRF